MVPVVIGVIGSVSKKIDWNSTNPKDSFRTIREKCNILALGHLLWPAH